MAVVTGAILFAAQAQAHRYGAQERYNLLTTDNLGDALAVSEAVAAFFAQVHAFDWSEDPCKRSWAVERIIDSYHDGVDGVPNYAQKIILGEMK